MPEPAPPLSPKALRRRLSRSKSKGDKEAEKEAQEVASKGTSLEQIVNFFSSYKFQKKLKDDTTCNQVLHDVVYPETRSHKCCYMDIMPGGPKPGAKWVSHWWGMTLRDLALSLAQDATDLPREDLDPGLFAEDMAGLGDRELDQTYWIAIFGVNHYAPMNFLDSIGMIMQNTRGVVVAIDPDLKYLGRSWCLMEIEQAIITERGLSYHLAGAFDVKSRQGKIKVSSLSESETKEARDKDQIMERFRKIGTEAFDAKVSLELLNGVRSLALVKAAEEARIQDLRTLIKFGTDANLIDRKTGLTPFLIAMDLGHQKLATVLLEELADPNLSAKFGRGVTPLHFALEKGDRDIVKELLKKEADPNGQDWEGLTLLHKAATQDQIFIVEACLEARGDPNAKEATGLTPLHVAAKEGALEFATTILAWQADPNARSGATPGHPAGATPLHRAAWAGHLKLLAALIDKRADIHATTDNGTTPLHSAASSGNEEIAQLLMSKRADLLATNGRGQTPYQVAGMCGHRDKLKMLLS